MHRFAVLAVIGVLGTAPVASAADLPVKAPAPAAVVAAPYNWTGFYIGVNGGYGWGGSTGHGINVVADPTGVFIGYPAAGGFRYPDLSPEGGFGGGQIGYNFQTANWVWGVVADFQFANLTDSGNAFVPAFSTFLATSQTHSAEVKWFGTVRGRVGWAFNQFLPYVSGGLAYGRVSSSLSLVAPTTGYTLSGSSETTKTGWTVGAGFEYALTSHVSLGVDYLYMDLGHDTVSATNQNFFAFPATLSMDHHFTANIARAVLNVKF